MRPVGTRHRLRSASAAFLLVTAAAPWSFTGVCAEEPPGPQDPEGLVVREISILPSARVVPRRLDDAAILRAIRTRAGRPFSARVWEEDWGRLAATGRFLDHVFEAPRVEHGEVRLRIEVAEWPIIRNLRFVGNREFRRSDLMNVIQSQEGGIGNRGRIYEDAVRLRDYYRGKSYYRAQVKVSIRTLAGHRQFLRGVEGEYADEVEVSFEIQEGGEVVVDRIVFEGHEAFSDGTLLRQLLTKTRVGSRDLMETNLELDVRRLKDFYQRNGYLDVEAYCDPARDVAVGERLSWDGKPAATVTYRIREGRQYRVGRVEVGGVKELEEREVRAVMQLRAGRVFNLHALHEDAQRIRDLYGEYGRAFTRVQYDLPRPVSDPERLRGGGPLADARFTVQEGAPVTVREIISRGNLKTRDQVILREIGLKPGDRFDSVKLRQAENRLRRLDFFEPTLSISARPVPEDQEQTDLVVEVAETRTGKFSFGAGFSSVESFFGYINLLQTNFDVSDLPKSWQDFAGGASLTGAGQELSVTLSLGLKRSSGEIALYEPWFLGRPIGLGGRLFLERSEMSDEYREKDAGFSLTLGRRLFDDYRWRAEVGYTFKLVEVTNSTADLPPILGEQQGDYVLSYFTPRLIYDSRDSRRLPASGAYGQLAVEIGGGPFFGSYDWIRPSLEAARYFTVYQSASGDKHVLELHGMAAAIEPLGDTKEVPPFLRYYAGGMGTIRGFDSRSIAPREDNLVIGGKRLVTGSIQYSLPILQEVLRFGIFVDAGQVWDSGRTDPGHPVTSQSGWRASTGLALIMQPPGMPAPIYIHFSRAIHKQKEDQEKPFDFSLGWRF